MIIMFKFSSTDHEVVVRVIISPFEFPKNQFGISSVMVVSKESEP